MVPDVLNGVNSDRFPVSWVFDCWYGDANLWWCLQFVLFVMKVVLLMSVFVYMSFSSLRPHLKAHFSLF